jgi:hypothetical protein
MREITRPFSTLFSLKQSFPVPKPNNRSKSQNPSITGAFIPTYDIFTQQVEWSLGAFDELPDACGHLETENPTVSQLTWTGWDVNSPADTLVIVPDPTPFHHTSMPCDAIPYASLLH